MSEWWTYRLSSFRMFSPRTYWRLVDDYNGEAWPWHLVALAVAAALVVIAWRRAPRATRVVSIAMAIGWLHVGVSFFWLRYAQIFTAAPHLAVASCAQAALLVAASAGRSAAPRSATGLLLALAGVLLYPAASAALHAFAWSRAEVVGFMPDPTALSTIGFVLMLHAQSWLRIVLCAIPCVVLAFGWGTLVNLA